MNNIANNQLMYIYKHLTKMKHVVLHSCKQKAGLFSLATSSSDLSLQIRIWALDFEGSRSTTAAMYNSIRRGVLLECCWSEDPFYPLPDIAIVNCVYLKSPANTFPIIKSSTTYRYFSPPSLLRIQSYQMTYTCTIGFYIT